MRLNGMNICQATALTIAHAKDFFSSLKLSTMHEEIAGLPRRGTAAPGTFSTPWVSVLDPRSIGFDAVGR